MHVLSSLYQVWSSLTNRVIIISTILCYALISGFIWYGRSSLPPELPLYYSLAHGEAQLASQQELLGIPILLIAIIIGNTLIAFAVYSQWPVLSKIILISSFLLCALMSITIFKIVTLVI